MGQMEAGMTAPTVFTVGEFQSGQSVAPVDKTDKSAYPGRSGPGGGSNDIGGSTNAVVVGSSGNIRDDIAGNPPDGFVNGAGISDQSIQSVEAAQPTAPPIVPPPSSQVVVPPAEPISDVRPTSSPESADVLPPPTRPTVTPEIAPVKGQKKQTQKIKQMTQSKDWCLLSRANQLSPACMDSTSRMVSHRQPT
jgi:hypothetical protein